MTDYEDLPRDELGEVLADRVVFPVAYTLLHPITVDGAEVTAVHLREPTVRDLEAVWKEKEDLARSRAILSLSMEMTPDNVRDLGARDFGKLSALVTAFL